MTDGAPEALLAATAALLLAAAPVAAAPTPLGSEVQVNQYVNGPQDRPDIASDEQGFVVVWEGPGIADSDSDGVALRSFGWDGLPIGAEMQVNSYTTGAQNGAAVAVSASGRMIVWDTDGGGDGDGDGGAVLGRFEPSHAAPSSTSTFVVNSYTTGDQDQPAVAAGSDGGFVVAWRSNHDGSGSGIFARSFDASGVALAAEFVVPFATQLNQSVVALAPGADGEYFAMWRNNTRIAARRISAAGTVLGLELDFGGIEGNSPSVAKRGEAGLVAVFQAPNDHPGGDGDAQGISAMLLDSMGTQLGTRFVVNSYTTGNQVDPDVASDGDGRFLVAWHGFFQDIPGENSTGTFAQAFGPDGLPDGDEIQVNAYTTSGQDNASVTARADGIFAVAWESSQQDGSSNGVFVRRYDVANRVFRDDFELGDTCSWDASVPTRRGLC